MSKSDKLSWKAKAGIFVFGIAMLLTSIYIWEGIFEGIGSSAPKSSSPAPQPSQDNSAFSL